MEQNATKTAKLRDCKASLIPTAKIRPAMELHPFVDAFREGEQEKERFKRVKEITKRLSHYKWLTAKSLSMSFNISPTFMHSCLYNHVE